MGDDEQEALMRRVGPLVDALLDLPREDAEATVREWQRRAPAAIVDDPGPEAMLAGLQRAYDRAVADGKRPVGIVVCRRYWNDLNRESMSLPPDSPLIPLDVQFSCNTRSPDRPCSCARSKGPALAVEAVMPVPVVEAA